MGVVVVVVVVVVVSVVVVVIVIVVVVVVVVVVVAVVVLVALDPARRMALDPRRCGAAPCAGQAHSAARSSEAPVGSLGGGP